METPRTVLAAVGNNDYVLTTDLKDAYFQIPIYPSWKFLRFSLGELVFQFKILCFGLTTAPQVFTRVFTLVSTWVHAQGVCRLRYLDDWLVLAHSWEKLIRDKDRLLQFCCGLGVVINLEMSIFSPVKGFFTWEWS